MKCFKNSRDFFINLMIVFYMTMSMFSFVAAIMDFRYEYVIVGVFDQRIRLTIYLILGICFFMIGMLCLKWKSLKRKKEDKNL